MTSEDKVKDDEQTFRKAAMEGDWRKVLKMYEHKSELRTLKIPPTGNTVLHMAASRGDVYRVQCMVDLVCQKRNNEKDETPSVDENGTEKELVLGAKNEKDDTPLHLAASASKGSVEMCEKIGKEEPYLITRCNKAGETPLFMAALHGNKEAFLWLHYKSHQGSPSCDDAHYKRNNNDTILHCAMAGGHIDLVIEIIFLYKEHLHDMIKRNENGLSPLHLLAATPSAFESTDLLNRSFIVQLLYHSFLRVKKKKRATTAEELEKQRESMPLLIMLMFACTVIMASSWVGIIWLLIGILLAVLVVLPLLPPAVLVVLFVKAGNWFRGIRKMKEKHTWSLQIVEELLRHASCDCDDIAEKPYKEDNEAGSKIVDTPLMIAAKNGVIEMVEEILESFPSWKNLMNVVDDEGKNIVLLAAEKRQTKLYQFLCGYGYGYLDNPAFRKVDKDGNTALHLAAKAGMNLNWQTTTMVEEFKWFKFVKSSVPSELVEKYNNDGKTAEEIFNESYKEHMANDRKWLNQTSQSSSVASTLVASMAFSNIVAHDFNEKKNSSLVALSLSLTSTISFLAILAFRSQSRNFWRYAPFMLQIAILTMFGSIVALWISLMLHGHSLTTYAIFGSPIALLTIVSLPIFIGPALMSIFTKVPPPNRNTTGAIYYRRPQKKENATDFDRNQEPTWKPQSE